MEWYLGMDIGGSHMAAGLVRKDSGELAEDGYARETLNSGGTADEILGAWEELIRRMLHQAGQRPVAGIGIAMPGPFDYAQGISLIRGLHKFDDLYGFDVKKWLKATLGLDTGFPVVFENDAACFGRGECWSGAAREIDKAVAITLGTGLGASFLVGGEPVEDGPEVPPGGVLYKLPYRGRAAEETLSARGILETYRKATGRTMANVRDLAQAAGKGEKEALSVFRTFGTQLGEFTGPWLNRFDARVLVLGGGISGASALFLPALEASLQEQGVGTSVRISQLKERAAVIGAAAAVKKQAGKPPIRRSGQPVLPLRAPETPEKGYALYPSFPLPGGRISSGWDALSELIVSHQTVLIDGYQGVLWDEVASELSEQFARRGLKVRIQRTEDWFLPPAELDVLLAPYLGEDTSVWGFRTDKTLRDLFDPRRVAASRPVPGADIHIVLGPGAALADPDAPVIYFEIPKNEIQYRMRAGSVFNLGCRKADHPTEMYKRAYFVDWILLNRHRKEILGRIITLGDCQHAGGPAWISMETFREAARAMAENVFRVRPWFEPGAWGGQWLKRHVGGIAQDEVNYAWSFELITPENGILLESGGLLLEASFDYLMLLHGEEILGKEFAQLFGDAFPIRFDFLDTVEGGNLSIQCHPGVRYIREHFGEAFTQDETYYILDAVPDAGVYLGFQEDIDPGVFREALETSNRESVPLDMERFVQRHPASRHDLFLIPHGTVHSAGAGNLVLEISATPYIFTFKMYDWLRLDLNGDPRPINIGHAFHNLDFSRKGDRVRAELISAPKILAEGPGWKQVHLPTHPAHFYDVHRYEFSGTVEIQTGGSCHVLMVVEGEGVGVETRKGLRRRFPYAETFVIPASAGSYRLTAEAGAVKVVKAFLKPGAAGILEAAGGQTKE